MSYINCGSFGLGSAGDALASSGTFSFQNTILRGTWSDYALRCNPTTNGVGYVVYSGLGANGAGASAALTNSYTRFYFYYVTKPGSSSEEFFVVSQSIGVFSNIKLTLRLNSSGTVSAYDTNNSLLSTGSKILLPATWYEFKVKCGTGGSASYEVKINDVVELSGTGDLNATATASIIFGKVNNRNNQSVDFYYSDWALENSNYPPTAKCKLLTPNANGINQTWSIGAGSGEHYQQVDETPPDSDTSYLVSTGSASDAETESINDGAATIGTGVINGIKTFIIVKRDGGTNGSITFRNRVKGVVTNLGTELTTLASYIPCSAMVSPVPSNCSEIEAGAIEASTNKTRMTFVGMEVDYSTPTTRTTDGKSF